LMSRPDYIMPDDVLEARKEVLDRLCEEFGVKGKSNAGRFQDLRQNEKFENMWQHQLNLIIHPVIISKKQKEEFAIECPALDKDHVESFIKKQAVNYAYRPNEFEFNKDLFKLFTEKFRQCKKLVYSVNEYKQGKLVTYAIQELAAIMDIITTNKLSAVRDFYIKRYLENEKMKMLKKFNKNQEVYTNMIKMEKSKLLSKLNDEEKEMLDKVEKMQKKEKEEFLDVLAGNKKDVYDKVMKMKMEMDTDMVDRVLKEKIENHDPFDRIRKRIEIMDKYNKVKLLGKTTDEKIQTLLYELDKLKVPTIEKVGLITRKHQLDLTTSEIGLINYKGLLKKVGKTFIKFLDEKLENDYTSSYSGGDNQIKRSKKRVSPIRKLELIKEERLQRLRVVNEQLETLETDKLLNEKVKIDQEIKKLESQLLEERRKEAEKKKPTEVSKKTSRGIMGMKFTKKTEEKQPEIKEEVLLQKEMMTARVRSEITTDLETKLEYILDKLFPMLVDTTKKMEQKMKKLEDEMKGEDLELELASDDELKLIEDSDEELTIIQPEDLVEEEMATQKDRDYSLLELDDEEADLTTTVGRRQQEQEEQEEYGYEEQDEAYDVEEQEYDYGAENSGAEDDYNI
jgi:hypothetical protein